MVDSHDDDGKANENDIESPAEPSTTPDTPASKKHISAEPPRWRFVGDAKRSSGYSSLAAGQYIQGKSSEELGAKYMAPDVSLYKDKRENEVGKLQQQLPTSNNYSKEDVEVGKLKLNVPNDDTSSSQNIEAGKSERKPIEEDELSELQTDLPDKPFEEGDDNENNSGDESPNFTQLNGETPSGAASRTDQNEGSQLDDQLDEEAMKEGTKLNSPEASNDEDMDDSAKESNPNRKYRFLYLMVILLLVMVIVLGVLLGKKSNAGEASASSDNAAATPDVLGPTIVINSTNRPSSYPSTALTNVPSVMPSLAPSAECKFETKAFSIEHPHEGKSISTTLDGSPYHATWILKNACSEEVIAQCRPCSLGALALTSPRSNLFSESIHRTEQKLLQNITECLPVNNEYVFGVQPAQVSVSCCGFDPNTFIISYDNVVMANAVADGTGVYSNNWSTTYFGESETSCKSESKSASPTSASANPSLIPSYEMSYIPSSIPSTTPTISPITNPSTFNPSTKPVTSSPSETPTSVSPITAPSYEPTTIPSAEPITVQPTASPLAFLGVCPETYGPISAYTLGARVESNGLVYQCVSVSCRSYGLEPGRNWMAVGSCSNPTLSPTYSPSKSPPRLPTSSPSKAPTDVPSDSPSKRPSNSPIKQPSASPIVGPTKSPTDSPSKDPSRLPTRSPTKAPTKRPSASPSKKPTTAPIIQPSASPSKQPSTSPIKQPTLNPSKAPTEQPTNAPSRKPSPRPTLPPRNVPTSQPTCSKNQEPFSICFAINMSGSICNGPTEALCTECTELPDLQDSFCRDAGVSWGSCCDNFADIKRLTLLFVILLGNLPEDKDFSVVEFASDARVVSGLSSTGKAVSAVTRLSYSGGLDNHASAIEMCQQTLSPSSNRKRIIVLITDGETGMPNNVPKGAAESAATSAKNEGTFIIPVLVSPDAPDTNEGAIPLMNRISSDGEVYDFTDYGVSSIAEVQERLIDQILCF